MRGTQSLALPGVWRHTETAASSSPARLREGLGVGTFLLDDRIPPSQHPPRPHPAPLCHAGRTPPLDRAPQLSPRRKIQPPDAPWPLLRRFPLPRSQAGDRTRRHVARNQRRLRPSPRRLDDHTRLPRAALRQCRCAGQSGRRGDRDPGGGAFGKAGSQERSPPLTPPASGRGTRASLRLPASGRRTSSLTAPPARGATLTPACLQEGVPFLPARLREGLGVGNSDKLFNPEPCHRIGAQAELGIRPS
jgi:hypothetical protein